MAEEQTNQPAAGSGDSHVEQFRADPEKGVQMYSEATARADRAEAALKKFESLEGYAEKYGDNLPKVVEWFETVSSNQEIVDALQTYEKTGKFSDSEQPKPAERNVSDDPYLTDEEKAMREQITSLTAQVSTLESALNGMSGSLGQDSLQRNVVEAAREMNLPKEVFERVSGALKQEFAAIEKRDPASLQRLIGPSGRETITRAIRQHLTNDDYEAIVANKRSQRTTALRDLETDGPSGIATDGAAQQPDRKKMSVVEAFKWAEEHPELVSSR